MKHDVHMCIIINYFFVFVKRSDIIQQDTKIALDIY